MGIAVDSVVRLHTGKKLLEKLRLPGKTAEVDEVTRIVEHGGPGGGGGGRNREVQ